MSTQDKIAEALDIMPFGFELEMKDGSVNWAVASGKTIEEAEERIIRYFKDTEVDNIRSTHLAYVVEKQYNGIALLASSNTI